METNHLIEEQIRSAGRVRVEPIFVFPRHLVDFDEDRRYVLASTKKYRIPEPIRFAHKITGEKARENG